MTLLPMCPEGCGCRLGTDDPDARECGCDGLCTAELDAMTEEERDDAAERSWRPYSGDQSDGFRADND
jgi:hypothetical protein